MPRTFAGWERTYEVLLRHPTEMLADSDRVTLETIRKAKKTELKVIAPVPKLWNKDSEAQDEATREWIDEMQSDPNKEAYRGRKALAERPNSVMKVTMGLDRLPVRGLDRVESLALLVAIVIDITEHRAHWLN